MFGERLGLAGAVGQRHRQHAGAAQAVDQGPRGVDVRQPGQASEIDDHRRTPEQLGRAFDAFAHLADQLVDVEGADAEVGDADLADLQFAGLFVIHGSSRHAHVPVGLCALASASRRVRAQGTSGRASP